MSRPTRTVVLFTATGLSPALAQFPKLVRLYRPHGLVRVRSPLLAESRLMSFPRGTEMFQFPPFALKTLYIQVISTWFRSFMCATAYRLLERDFGAKPKLRINHVLK